MISGFQIFFPPFFLFLSFKFDKSKIPESINREKLFLDEETGLTFNSKLATQHSTFFHELSWTVYLRKCLTCRGKYTCKGLCKRKRNAGDPNNRTLSEFSCIYLPFERSLLRSSFRFCLERSKETLLAGYYLLLCSNLFREHQLGVKSVSCTIMNTHLHCAYLHCFFSCFVI